jgi:hypothetical protein
MVFFKDDIRYKLLVPAQTQDPVSYPANAIGSTPGSGKSVWTKDLNTGNPNEAQLKRLVEGAEELLQQARMH